MSGKVWQLASGCVKKRWDLESCEKMRVVAENRSEMREDAGSCEKMRVVAENHGKMRGVARRSG